MERNLQMLFLECMKKKFGSFVRNRDIRRQAFPWELDENIKKEPKDSLSFNNLKRIEL